jgi:poly(A) polymerase
MSQPVSTRTALVASLPPLQAAIVKRIADAFTAEGKELALVGGIVRDLMLEIPRAGDLDFTTNARPEEIEAIGREAGADSTYDVGARFGTIGLVFTSADEPPVQVEITTYRAEHYPNSTRHPEIAFGERLVDDLARRDFTVNAMAIDVATNELIDPFDGQADLARAIVRAVGDPDLRFREDPLRLLRAARFVAQLGFLIDADTAAAMSRQASSLARISQERIYAELTRLLIGPFASHGLEALRTTGLLPEAMPEIMLMAREAGPSSGPHREKDLWDHTRRVVDRSPSRATVRWAALLHDAGKPMTRSIDENGQVHFFGHEHEGAILTKRLLGRLKAEKWMQSHVQRLVELHLRPATYDATWTDSAVRRLMLEADGVLDDLLDLAAADVTSAREYKQRAAAQRIADLRAHIERLEEERALAELKSPLDGDELMALFAKPPGRWIATIKNHLRELVIEGELDPDDKVGAEQIARTILEEEQQ